MDPTCRRKSNLKISMTFEIEEQEDEGWRFAIKRKNTVLEFLKKEMNESLLRRYQTRVEVLRKCSFYIEILPRHLAVGDQNNFLLPITMFQLIDPWKFHRMKEIGTSQTKIQLLLLEEFLDQLHTGRVELIEMVQSYHITSFLTKWDYISQRLTQMTSLLDKFVSMLVPGRLYMKHHLISHIGCNNIPTILLVLRTKTPVMFDRKECEAHEDWVSLKWNTLGQQTQTDKYEICFKKVETTQDSVQSVTISINTNSSEIHNLLRDQMYEFSIRRAETHTLVYEAWHDVMTLKTQANKTQQDTKCYRFANYKRHTIPVFCPKHIA
ncbi:fibronectin type III domain-containing protein 11 isoform X2 [Mixophyes fleayi]